MAQASSDPGRRSLARGAVFAALAAALLFGLARGWIAPLLAEKARWAALYVRAGDTYLGMCYLLGDRKAESSASRKLLATAASYYLRAASADRGNTRAFASAGLALAALGRGQEARFMLAGPAARPRTSQERMALRRAMFVAFSWPPRADQVEEARSFLEALGPGPLVLSRAYRELGHLAESERTWALAEARGERLVPRLLAVLTVCGLLMAAGVVGLVMALASLLHRRAREPMAAPPAPWGLREATEALLLWAPLAVAVGAGLARLGVGRGEAALASSLFAGAAAITWAWAVAPRGRGFGWRPVRPVRDVLLGLAVAGVAAPLALVLEGLVGRALGGLESVQHPLVPLIADAAGWAARGGLIAAACVVAPVVEEALFRGIVFRGLRREWPLVIAAAGSAALFALAHASRTALLPYALVGVALAVLYEHTGSLAAPVAAHGAFNAFQLAILVGLYG